MAGPSAQQCHALTTYYINKYEETFGRKPVVNRNTAKAGIYGLLMDYSQSEARELIDHYLKHWAEPTLQWFLYNYDKVVESKEDREKEEKARVERRKVTERRLEEWRARWKK